jgi:glycogen operon protein
MEVGPGEPHPLGASWDGTGTAFAIFSEMAERVELCLVDAGGAEARVDLPERTGPVFHGYLKGIGPGQRYGYRVHGPLAPELGQHCDPRRLLLDPYAKAIEGGLSLVIDTAFDWGEDRPPRTPLEESIVYELHVKGFTELHPGVPEELRGTYAGLAHPASIAHLNELGVTAVELLPIHEHVTAGFLRKRGLVNYWGYSTIGFFAPHAAYASRPGAQVAEMKGMVKLLHAAGIEVILDVVYNHTGEGEPDMETLSFRGIDNLAYYRQRPDEPALYVDATGCGNTVDVSHPHVLQLVMDSLRYWVSEMHVDGFRFDLATALARGPDGAFDPRSAFLQAVQQDPVLRGVKLIAEPWDLGEHGYRLGGFPPEWSEWNDRYRDSVRDFWRGHGHGHPLGDLAWRLTGSPDVFAAGRRPATASINFVTSHDGFTLTDLVSYNAKHNQANAEGNRDGASDNRSWNCGIEGPTDEVEILELRARQKRNLLVTLLVSQGVPMLLAGDEIGRTQLGNNNAYCQDNELSWIDWAKADAALLAFVRRLIELRRRHPVLRQRRFLQPLHVRWFRPDGAEMTDPDWPSRRGALGMFLSGDHLGDDSFFLMMNAGHDRLEAQLPASLEGRFSLLIDTFNLDATGDFAPGDRLPVEPRSLRLLLRPRP